MSFCYTNRIHNFCEKMNKSNKCWQIPNKSQQGEEKSLRQQKFSFSTGKSCSSSGNAGGRINVSQL